MTAAPGAPALSSPVSPPARASRRRLLGAAGLVMLAAQGLPASGAEPLSCETGSGAFAFRYAARLTPEEQTWLARFRIVVPGSVLPADQGRTLQRAGVKLLVYEWLTGFYFDAGAGTRPDQSWESFVHHAKPGWLLNPERPDDGPDGRGRAYYYDPSNPDLQRAWARHVARILDRSSYDGVFLDLVGSLSVPEPLRRVHAGRHPGASYDKALGGFLGALRRTRPKTLIFTNQGYRIPAVYLPLADYDLSESLMTSYAWGEPVRGVVAGEPAGEVRETYYRPWDELKPIVDSIDADVRRYNPRVRILHLNYVNPRYEPAGRAQSHEGRPLPVLGRGTDRPAIYYGYAAAKLWGHESYGPADELRFGQDPIYFADLGRPRGDRWEERDGVVTRYYDRGVVVVNPSSSPRTLDLASPYLPAGVSDLLDCYAGRSVGGLTVTIEPTISAASGRSYPAGRIYLHSK